MKWANYFLNNSTIIFHYLKELKYKFIYSILMIVFTSISCYFYINQIIYILTDYLLNNMSSHRFIFTKLTEVFFTYIKFSLLIGILISTPFILINFWLFFIPGMYEYENNNIKIFIIFITILFSFSLFITYNFILPNILKFFLFFEQNNSYFPIHFEAKLNDYLIPIFILLIDLNLCFQIPAILSLCIYYNLITFKFLIKKRKYFYISFILLSALISPPDLYNQIFLTFLIIFLYEVLIFFLFFFKRFFFIS